MLQRLYVWAAGLSTSRSAEAWLAGIAFVESSIFLVPADVLFVPMVIARPDRAYRLATIATIASVAGGIAGWLMGFYAYETIARPVLAFYGKQEAFEHLRSYVDTQWIALLLLSSGFTHFPPIKVVTILSGVVHVNLLVFIFLAIVARGGRFFLLGAVLQRYGTAALAFIKNRRRSIFAVSAVCIVVVLLGYGVARQF